MPSFSRIRRDWAATGPTIVCEPSAVAATPSAPALDLRNSRRELLLGVDVSASGVGASDAPGRKLEGEEESLAERFLTAFASG